MSQCELARRNKRKQDDSISSASDPEPMTASQSVEQQRREQVQDEQNRSQAQLVAG